MYRRWMQVQTNPPSMQQVRSALASDEALAEFVIATPDAYAFLATREGLTLQHLVTRSEIDGAVADHVRAINNRQNARETGKRLYSLLLERFASQIQSKRLVIVRDGSLYQIPFDTLVDQTGEMLLQKTIISYTPSATVLALLRKEQFSPNKDNEILLGVSSSARPLSTQASGTQASPDGLRSASVFEPNGLNLSSLAAANEEVQDVAGVIGPSSSILIDADEATFKKANLTRFEIIHLAVHGVADTKDPGHSMLIFRPNSASGEDGFLQAREIALLPLHADLVTLAACHTAAGRVNGEEGITSLVRPFLIAGAESVVANLWETDDQFSRGLMVEFYTRLVHGDDVATALTQAKRIMIRKFGDQAPPYLWAGFVIEGDGSRLIGKGR